MNEYILFTKWSLKNPFYVFSYLCKKIFKISQNLITKKIKYFNNYNLQNEKITKKKINITIELAGEKLKIIDKINWNKKFIDPESEERLHRLSWIIDLISNKKISKYKIQWCESQILDWYNKCK